MYYVTLIVAFGGEYSFKSMEQLELLYLCQMGGALDITLEGGGGGVDITVMYMHNNILLFVRC